MTPLEKLLAQLNGEIGKLDADKLAELARAYDRMVYKPVQGDIDALIKLISAGNVTNVRNTTEFKRLIGNITEELTKWQGFMDGTIAGTATGIIPVGINHAKLKAMAAGLKGTFRKFEPAQIEKLLGYLDSNSELYKRIGKIAPTYADNIAQAIVDGVTAGKNPKTIAGLLTRNMGMALTDSLRMTRTVQIWSYREAGRASYIANSDVVEGWIWYADISGEPCASCWAMHGTFHTNDETLDDHYNGKCTAIPKLYGSNPDIPSGADLFSQLDESKQRDILGDAKYEALQDGKFQFSQLSTQHEDDVYGHMRGETPLKDLLGE